MRSPLRKKVIALIRREFEERYPRFALLDSSGPLIKIWGWKVAPELTLFAALQIFRESADEFAAEIAWSENHEFPWHEFGMMVVEKPRGRVRLGNLWEPGGGVTWDLAPEVKASRRARVEMLRRGDVDAYRAEDPIPPIEVAMLRIAPAVEDCLAKFEQYALPFFNAVAAHRGVTDIQWRNPNEV